MKKLSITDLQLMGACRSGLRVFRQIHGDYLDLDSLDAYQAVAMAVRSPIYYNWLRKKGILPVLDVTGCDLSHRDLSGAEFGGAVFSKADLTGSDLSRSRLLGAKLDGAKLVGTNFTGALLIGADLRGAVTTGAIFKRAVLTDVLYDGVLEQ